MPRTADLHRLTLHNDNAERASAIALHKSNLGDTVSKTKKKFKRQNRRQKFPWLPIALGGVLLITAVFFLARQDSNRGGTPSIIVDPQRIDYGDVKLGVNKTFSIKVTNAGDGTLRFMEEPYIQVLEGC
jgi:hypothetical protein